MDSLTIGPMVYRVVEKEGLSSDGQTIYGQVNYGECEILVEARNDLQQRRQTVWHEVMHVLLTQAGLVKDAKREELIDPLAYGLMQVVRDNPGLCGGYDGGEDAG